MKVELAFLGAAENVTGSRYLLDAGGRRVLVDCGLYQERSLKARNWGPFPVPPASIDAVLLTHAHLDHCGLLPKLARDGFRGRIYCTPATQDIARIVLLDSARIQEEDAAFKQKRHVREGRAGPFPEAPLYTVQDAENCLPLFEPVSGDAPVKLAEGLEASFHEAGHILGSAMIRFALGVNGERRILIFSGDVGRWDMPIIRDPTVFSEADYVVVESTYGDRTHGAANTIPDDLAACIGETRAAGGNVIIPSFAVERTQDLLYHLSGLLRADRIPHLMVFVDSPMAVRVTEVFRRHPELFDAETAAMLREGKHPCDFPGLRLCQTVDESKAINHIRGSAVIIAGSGMCTGGRVKHHLAANIQRPESTVLFVGYQAVGTLGRIILDGADDVRILGQTHPVRARIRKITGFSAHADRDELFRWLSGLQRPPRHVFVTHGEPEAAQHFAAWLGRKTGWSTSVPKYEERAVIE